MSQRGRRPAIGSRSREREPIFHLLEGRRQGWQEVRKALLLTTPASKPIDEFVDGFSDVDSFHHPFRFLLQLQLIKRIFVDGFSAMKRKSCIIACPINLFRLSGRLQDWHEKKPSPDERLRLKLEIGMAPRYDFKDLSYSIQ